MKIKRFLAILLTLTIMAGFCVPVVSPSAEETEEFFKPTPVGSKQPTEVKLDYASAEELLAEMKLVASTADYELYFHHTNLVAAVKDKRSGKVYFTNPYNAASDKYYTENIRRGLESQVVITYADASGEPKTMWSSDSCANLGQWEMKPTDSGMEVTYSIGEEKERLLVPLAVPAERFETIILSHFKEGSRARRRLEKVLYDKTEKDGTAIYQARKLTKREQNEVEGYMKEAGYTFEDMDADHAATGMKAEDRFFPNFQFKLVYELTETGLRVSIPTETIRYDVDHFHLLNIKMLEYFGAVNATEEHEGYLFLPDGSGTIVDFSNKDPKRQLLISSQLYNYDCAVTYPQNPRQGRTFHLPVYGIKKDDSALFAIVSQGSGLATLTGYAGNGAGQYYAAFPTFSLTTREKLELEQKVASPGSSTVAFMYDENVYTGTYAVDYTFLNGDRSDYVGMAHYYQAYLEKQGMARNGAKHIPLSIETVGTLNYINKFLGIPYEAAAKLTTFDQTKDIVAHFRDAGVTDLTLTLQAWRRGGLDYTAANRLDPSRALGGKKAFLQLNAWCREQNIPCYPLADPVFVNRDRFFDGFKPNKDTLRLMNDKWGGFMSVRPDLGAYDKTTFAFGVNPLLYKKNLDAMLAAFDKNELSSVGLSTLGTFLNSNFKKDSHINREQNLQQIQEMLKGAAANHALQFDGGNGYVLPYASSIRNVPMSSSGYRGTVSVPFLQIVLNGMISYSSEPLNTEYDMDLAILRCIESGTAPHFVLAADNIRKIKQTDHTEYYSIDIKHWQDTVLESYRAIEKALADTEGAVIVGHTVIGEDAVMVTWSNGCRIYVNFSDEAVVADGQTVAPRSYVSVKGGNAQ